jgi:hypothetical protein
MPRGGRRKGAGRPMGSKNKLPGGKEFTEELKSVVRQYEDSEYLYTNENRLFEGSSLAFIQSVKNCESLPVKIRLYAACKAVEYEANAGEHQFDSTGRVILWLPHNKRDPLGLHDGDEDRDIILKQLERLSREEHRQRDEQLHKWIDANKLHEDCALLCRSQWAEEGDMEWVSVAAKPGHPADTAPLRLLENGGMPRQNGADSLSSAPPMPQTDGKLTAAPNGHAPVRRVQPLYSHPGIEFKDPRFVVDGHKYEADGAARLSLRRRMLRCCAWNMAAGTGAEISAPDHTNFRLSTRFVHVGAR